jgi:hypothetical protein
MSWYIAWVTRSPLLSAAIQFGLLGSFGEMLSQYLRRKTWIIPGRPWQLGAKVLAWALLGVVIKYGFTGMRGFVSALLEHHLIPSFFATGLGFAFMLSFSTNIFFGPQMMAFHRLEENWIMREWNWASLTKAWATLIWFWIPAHTITFALPREFQIGLAAFWSVALGLILGLASQQKQAPQAAK